MIAPFVEAVLKAEPAVLVEAVTAAVEVKPEVEAQVDVEMIDEEAVSSYVVVDAKEVESAVAVEAEDDRAVEEDFSAKEPNVIEAVESIEQSEE